MTDSPALLAALDAELAQARTRVTEFSAMERAYAQARGDSDADDEHDPEGSTLAWERAAAAASRDTAIAHLDALEAARARVLTGWDGACAGCGRPIAAERLAVRPQADRCVSCAARPLR